MICISETYLDSSISVDDKRIQLDGYNLIRADHPNKIKKGGVCIYYKEPLCIKNMMSLLLINIYYVTFPYKTREGMFLFCIGLQAKIIMNLMSLKVLKIC